MVPFFMYSILSVTTLNCSWFKYPLAQMLPKCVHFLLSKNDLPCITFWLNCLWLCSDCYIWKIISFSLFSLNLLVCSCESLDQMGNGDGSSSPKWREHQERRWWCFLVGKLILWGILGFSNRNIKRFPIRKKCIWLSFCLFHEQPVLIKHLFPFI